MRRRQMIAAGLVPPALAARARAQGAAAWPQHPVRLLVPFAPGGPVEVPARFIAEQITPRLGQPVIVEARPGAGGALGIQAVVQANDPHLLLVTTSAVAILPALLRDPGFDPLRDLVPITMVSDAPMILLARPDHPVRDLADLLAQARARPDAITYGSSGTGSTTHLGGALFCARAGIRMLHVPYRGAAQAVNALYAGDTDLMVTGMGEGFQHVRDGRLRAIAVTAPKRIAVLPEVPAAAEQAPGYAISIWYGMFGPRATPSEVVQRMAALVAPMRQGSALAQRMAASGMELMLDGPDRLAARMATEVPLWKQVVEAAGVRAE